MRYQYKNEDQLREIRRTLLCRRVELVHKRTKEFLDVEARLRAVNKRLYSLTGNPIYK